MIFVGREKELAILETLSKRLNKNLPSIVFIDAEPGTGKSTLVTTFITSLPDESHLKISSMCTDKEGLTPYGGVKNALQVLQEKVGVEIKTGWKENFMKYSEPAKDILSSIPVVGGLAAASVSGLSVKMSEKKGNQFQDEPHVYMDYFLKYSSQKKVVLFLDDLQWIDTLTANFIFQFARYLQSKPSPVLIIGTYRPHEVKGVWQQNRRHPLLDKVNELRAIQRSNAQDFTFTEISLSAFGDNETSQIILTRFPENNFPNDFIQDKLFKISNGNPLFIDKALDHLVQTGGIIKENNIYTLKENHLSTIPNSLEGLIKERYELCSEKLKKLLDVASVNGYDFTIQILEKILKIDELDLLDDLEDLTKKYNLLVPGSTSRIKGRAIQTYNFAHALVYKFVYENISENKRRLLHSKCADLLGEVYGSTDEMPASIKDQYFNHIEIANGGDFKNDFPLHSDEYQKGFDELLKNKLMEAIHFLGQNDIESFKLKFAEVLQFCQKKRLSKNIIELLLVIDELWSSPPSRENLLQSRFFKNAIEMKNSILSELGESDEALLIHYLVLTCFYALGTTLLNNCG